jgi:hypothetical protein
MHISSPSTTQHTPPQHQSITVNSGKARVSTQQLPSTGITSAKRSLPIKIEHNTEKPNQTKATFADIFYSQQAMSHAQRNLEARRPPRWSGRQLFRRGACCFDFVIACVIVVLRRCDVEVSAFVVCGFVLVMHGSASRSGKWGLKRIADADAELSFMEG